MERNGLGENFFVIFWILEGGSKLIRGKALSPKKNEISSGDAVDNF